jgi:RNA polymerase sigma factor (sigma-70 family)
MQEAYVKLTENWPRVSSLETAGRQYAYLLKMVANEALLIIRHRNRRPGYLSPDLEENSRSSECVEERVLARDDLRVVWQAISELPEGCRVVVVLYTAGYPYGEIAAMLGLCASTVRSHMSNARKLLRPAAPGTGEGGWS